MSLHPSLKLANRWVIGLIVLATALTGATAFYSISQFGRAGETPQPTATVPPVVKITALGRLQPETEVVKVSAPLSLDKDRLAELLVKRGDRVKVGQIIAILDSRDRLLDALKQAQEQVQVSQARLAQVKAGAKTGEISAQQALINRIEAQWQGERDVQQATIRRLEAQGEGDQAAQQATIKKLEAELSNAEAELNRYQQLYAARVISTSLVESKRLSRETSRQQLNEAKVTLNRINRTAEQQLNEAKVTLNRIDRTAEQQLREAKATLNQIAEVRPVDVQAAQAEVNSAIATVKKATTDLKQVYIRAPITGRILEIHTKPGETLSDNGIVDLAQTDQMEVVAEVYQTDISKIRAGQKATITSESFQGELQATVHLIGLQVSQQNVFQDQPGENFDRRVVEVRVRLTPEDSQKVAALTNLQVQVAIEP